MNFFFKHDQRLKIPILMYHKVSEVPERNKIIRSTNPAYSISLEQFRKQMEYIYNNEYHTLSINELLDTSVCDHQESVIITFDDGWANNYTHAFPILKKLNLTATLFVISDFVCHPQYVDWYQLREMNKEGISIQSHTRTHRPLSELLTHEIQYELEESKKEIEDHLGVVVDFLSMPQGIKDHRVIKIAQVVGYKAICTSEPGFIHSHGNPTILKRINISDSYQISTFKRIIQTNHR
ncbi:MAG: polysaccharide deacetylase family protein, partial [Thermodesulfobacteriota bacterium]|nr:polysaccharide deacetylase family protein [Thermodesulfobacteriota bacterium]